ncbi:DUF2812 domain-containing protein [Clostridium estertheticum]|nr:DUF2812 domain-containing protein [Clostridium estertheticum]
MCKRWKWRCKTECHNDSDVALEYREYCEAAGWTYICEDGSTQIFYTEGDKQIISIHTDEEEKFKAVFKSSMKNVYGQMILNISNFLVIVSEDKVIFIAKSLSVGEDEFLNKAYEKLLSQ